MSCNSTSRWLALVPMHTLCAGAEGWLYVSTKRPHSHDVRTLLTLASEGEPPLLLSVRSTADSSPFLLLLHCFCFDCCPALAVHPLASEVWLRLTAVLGCPASHAAQLLIGRPFLAA